MDPAPERHYSPVVAPRGKQTWGFRFSPREWPTLFREVREHPEDVALGARVFFSIGGHDEGPTYRRFMRTAEGRALIEDRSDYPEIFTDYDRLRDLPDGTLGREYVRQLDERGIHPVELDALTQPCYEDLEFSPEHAYVRDRVRHAHDLWHTLTGYGIDIRGEAGVLSFTLAQTGNKGWAMLVLLNVLSSFTTGRFDSAVVAWKAYRCGRRAAFLPAADWDRLLHLPIEEAREELGITPMEPYVPLQLDEMFENAPKPAG